jgi:hypothetical protein
LPFVWLVNGFLETNWLSQVPALTVRLPAADLDPGTFQYAHHFAYLFSGFRHMKTLAFVQHGAFRGSILSLALRLTSFFPLASCGSLLQPHAEFRTELVVNLCSGWFVQLVNASFAWHTHITPLFCLIVRDLCNGFQEGRCKS